MRTGLVQCLVLGGMLIMASLAVGDAPFGEPLMDWSAWEQYRSTVQHPASYLQAADLDNARENIVRYQWAAEFARDTESGVRPYLERLTPEFIEQMIPATTALTCYQCPACHDQGLPGHPGGEWSWSVDDPEVLTCNRCKTVFPNDDYPETIVLEATSETGRGQRFSFYGGRTFRQWGYPDYRPTFTGGIRARKVQWSRSITYRMGLAYALTGKLEYAEATRLLLLRFAEVYPNWLLLTTYGEIADMHPHVAAFNIDNLPEDEMVYPPNQPDRKLYNGFWASCRAAGGGQEGSATNMWLSAYTLTYHAHRADGTPLYTEEEKLKIERDLILDSCVHLIAEKRINNKSVGNRIAVANVGIALGHPGFVRFGLAGWDLTMDQWFLADGSTPESPAYALMSLNGIFTLGQSIRSYSDPAGYTDDQDRRIENLNLYEGKYKLVWKRMFEGLQGDLYYPPYADSYRSSALGTRFAELLAANYPDNPQYLALLKEYAGQDLSRGHAETAIFFRRPGLEHEPTPPLQFSDNLFPVLCLGQVRTGEHGRRSLALLSATHWGGHHHLDSLNLYYWKDGHELLTDLGYLWDHPRSGMTRRTFAHNTGMVDLAEQRSGERGGRFDLFHTGERVKVMQAASRAYEKADLYQRTVIQVDHAPDNSYLLDIFRLQADGSRDLVYHGPNGDYTLSGIEPMEGDVTQRVEEQIRFGLRFHVTGAADEIQVDDVSILLADGTELAENSSAAELDERGRPVGWNHYSGSGSAQWGAASPGRTDQHCAYLKITDGDDINQALIHGNTAGYTGPNALLMPRGAQGRVSFWTRGNAARCNVSLVLWPTDPNSAADRDHVALGSVPLTDQWVQHTLDFSLTRRGMDLDNIRSAHSPDLWRAQWTLAEQLQLTAHHCGQAGEVTYIGDGWGQRDHRNTDIGVTIPYIVRRHPTDAGVSTFVTAYEAHPPGAPLVRSVRRLDLAAELGDGIAAVLVETSLGTDVLVSQLEPSDVTISTPVGRLVTDAAVAVLSVRNGQVAFAAVAEGSALQLNGASVAARRLTPESTLAEQIQEVPPEE